MKVPDYHSSQNTLYKKLAIAASLILGVLLVGTAGYMLLEGWEMADALYMTVITITTVGFHEVGGLSGTGRIFTMVLIFLGIGVGGYAVGNIAAFFVEGQMLNLLRGRKMEKEITNLKDHIIVCGCGKIGIEVCCRLHNMGEKFIVIDKDEDKISEALERDYLAAVGEATDDEILERAGIKHARGLISAISDDSANVYLVLTARALNANLRIIARGTDEASLKKMIRAGADRVVSPFEIGARRMAALMVQPDIIDFIDAFSPGATLGLRLEKVELHPSSELVGKRLDESHIKRDTGGALILAIEEQGLATQINPSGSTILKANDKLLAIADDEQIARLQQLAR